MMTEGGVAEVYADIISQQAYDVLNDAGVADVNSSFVLRTVKASTGIPLPAG